MNQRGLAWWLGVILIFGTFLIWHGTNLAITQNNLNAENEAALIAGNQTADPNELELEQIKNCELAGAECGPVCLEDETCIDCGACGEGVTCIENKCDIHKLGDGLKETGEDTGACFTVDGQEGINGEEFSERILWKWDFESIDLNTCAEYYCDATQFSLSLAQRLEKILELAEARNSIEGLKEFNAFISADNFSEDFRRDFAFYYTGHFFETPAWFNKWSEYFEDFNLMKFTPGDLRTLGSGEYKVLLNIELGGDENKFFLEDKPNAKIEIEFERVGGEPNSFNNLALNGQVGTKRKDEDGRINRKDYGIGFSGPDYQKFEDGMESKAASPKSLYTIELKSFEETNSKNGLIAFYGEENKTIVFSPNQATAVLVEPETLVDGSTNMFYRVYEDTKFVGEGKTKLAYWSDLSGQLIPYGEISSDASSEKINTCNEVKNDQREAFGLSFSQQIDSQPLLLSYFFTPTEKDILLEKSCDDETIFRTADEELSNLRHTLSLSLSNDKISELYELPKLMNEGKVCVQEDNDGTRFYWDANFLAGHLSALSVDVPQNIGIGGATPKGIIQSNGTRQISVRHYYLNSGSDREVRELTVPAIDSDEEIFAKASARRLGIFCFERPLVEAFKIMENKSQSKIISAKATWIFDKEYRGTLEAGEEIRATAKGFTKSLCFGTGTINIYLTSEKGNRGISVLLEKEVVYGDSVTVRLAEGPDELIEECSINWFDGKTQRINPELSVQFKSHFFDDAGEQFIRYSCTAKDGSEAAALARIWTPDYRMMDGLREGEYCTDCTSCCRGDLDCVATEPALIYQNELDFESDKRCCPQNSIWDGELCLAEGRYNRLARADPVDENTFLFTFDQESFEALREIDIEAFARRQEFMIESEEPLDEPEEFVIEDDEPIDETEESVDEAENTDAPPEDWGDPPSDWGFEDPPDDWGEFDQFFDSGVSSVYVEIWNENGMIENVELLESEEWVGEVLSLYGQTAFGAYWNTEHLQNGDYTAIFRIYGSSYSLVLPVEFSINRAIARETVSIKGVDHGDIVENIIIQANSYPDAGAVGTYFTVTANKPTNVKVRNIKLRVFKGEKLIDTISMKDDGKHADDGKNDSEYGAVIKAKKSRGYSEGYYKIQIAATDKEGKERPPLELGFTLGAGSGLCNTIHNFEPDENPPADKLKIAFFGEGFDSEEELLEFSVSAKDFLMSIEPFKSNKEKIIISSLYPKTAAGCKLTYNSLSKKYSPTCDWAKAEREVNKSCEADKIVIFYKYNQIRGSANGIWRSVGLVTSDGLNMHITNRTVAHELGHTLGLLDEYVYPKYKNNSKPSNISTWCLWSTACKLPPFMKELETKWNCSGKNTCSDWSSLENAECIQGCHKGGWYRSSNKNIMAAEKESVFSPAAEKILEAAINYFAEGGK